MLSVVLLRNWQIHFKTDVLFSIVSGKEIMVVVRKMRQSYLRISRAVRVLLEQYLAKQNSKGQASKHNFNWGV